MSSKPPARARPFTAEMTGLGNVSTASNTVLAWAGILGAPHQFLTAERQDLLEIGTGTERLAGAGQYDSTHGFVFASAAPSLP